MGKIRNQTYIEKLGFKDDELKDMSHDEMILHYIKSDNIIKLLDDLTGIEPDNIINLHIETEHPIKNNNYIIGFVDLWATYAFRRDDHTLSKILLLIEIKSRPIQSYGEVMRQINTYRSYIKTDRDTHLITVLVTNGDCKFKDAFLSQGVRIVEHGYTQPYPERD